MLSTINEPTLISLVPSSSKLAYLHMLFILPLACNPSRCSVKLEFVWICNFAVKSDLATSRTLATCKLFATQNTILKRITVVGGGCLGYAALVGLVYLYSPINEGNPQQKYLIELCGGDCIMNGECVTLSSRPQCMTCCLQGHLLVASWY